MKLGKYLKKNFNETDYTKASEFYLTKNTGQCLHARWNGKICIIPERNIFPK